MYFINNFHLKEIEIVSEFNMNTIIQSKCEIKIIALKKDRKILYKFKLYAKMHYNSRFS